MVIDKTNDELIDFKEKSSTIFPVYNGTRRPIILPKDEIIIAIETNLNGHEIFLSKK